MGGKFSKKDRYKVYEKPDKYQMKFRETNHFLYGYEVTFRQKRRQTFTSLPLEVHPRTPMRNAKSLITLTPNTNEVANLPTIPSLNSLFSYEEEMKAIKKSMENLDDSNENEDDLKINQSLKLITDDKRLTDWDELKGKVNSSSEDFNHFHSINEDVQKFTSTDKINNTTNKTSAEDEIKIVLHNLKEPRIKLKTAKTIEEFNDVKNSIQNQLIELNKIRCEDDKTIQYKNKVNDKIKQYKETIHEKIYQLSKPNINQHSIDSYNIIQETTVELNLLKQEIIDYFGTSYDNEYKNIVERLNRCQEMLDQMDPKGDFKILLCKEQYEDNINRLKEIFDKIIIDNEKDFLNNVEQISKIERRKDRRKKSTVIQFDYKSNNEDLDISKKYNTQVSTLSDLIDNINEEPREEQKDFIDERDIKCTPIFLNIMEPEHFDNDSREEVNNTNAEDKIYSAKNKFLRTISMDTTVSEVFHDCEAEPESDNSDEYEECVNFHERLWRGHSDIKTYPVDIPENGFAAIFGGIGETPEPEEKYEDNSVKMEEQNELIEELKGNDILDHQPDGQEQAEYYVGIKKYIAGNSEIEAINENHIIENEKIDENKNDNIPTLEEQKEIFMQRLGNTDNISFIQNLIVNQLFLENEREFCANEHNFENLDNLHFNTTYHNGNEGTNIISQTEKNSEEGQDNYFSNNSVCLKDNVTEDKSTINDFLEKNEDDDDYKPYTNSSSEESSESSTEVEVNENNKDIWNNRPKSLLGNQYKNVLKELMSLMSKKRLANRKVKKSQHTIKVDENQIEKHELGKISTNELNYGGDYSNDFEVNNDSYFYKNSEQKEIIEDNSFYSCLLETSEMPNILKQNVTKNDLFPIDEEVTEEVELYSTERGEKQTKITNDNLNQNMDVTEISVGIKEDIERIIDMFGEDDKMEKYKVGVIQEQKEFTTENIIEHNITTKGRTEDIIKTPARKDKYEDRSYEIEEDCQQQKEFRLINSNVDECQLYSVEEDKTNMVNGEILKKSPDNLYAIDQEQTTILDDGMYDNTSEDKSADDEERTIEIEEENEQQKEAKLNDSNIGEGNLYSVEDIKTIMVNEEISKRSLDNLYEIDQEQKEFLGDSMDDNITAGGDKNEEKYQQQKEIRLKNSNFDEQKLNSGGEDINTEDITEFSDKNIASTSTIHNLLQRTSSENSIEIVIPIEDLDEIEDDVADLPDFSGDSKPRGEIFTSKKKLKVVQECVDELKEQIERFEGNNKDENYTNLYDTLFDCMDILNLIKSSDLEIVNTKQYILNKLLKCIRDLEKKVKPKRKHLE